MNNLDKQYTDLLQDILDNGVKKGDRTGTGTISVFGRTIRHKMSEGFPLLTTKKMPFKTIVTELLWFLKGDTNIKYLVDNDCHIWDGDALRNFNKHIDEENNRESLKNPLDMYQPKARWTQEEFINKIKTDDEFAKKWGDLGPIYGKQWREWSNYRRVDSVDEVWSDYRKKDPIDQIQNLINDLKTNPDSRRLMVNAWNVAEIDQMVLPPCHYGFQVYTRELSHKERCDLFGHNDSLDRDYSYSKWLDDNGYPKRAISLMWNQRSVDTFLGLPFNIASYGLLLEIIAKEVNMVPDELIGQLGDTHLYLNHIEQAKEQIGRLSWEERKEFLTDGQRKEFGNISPFTDKMIHWWLNCLNIPYSKRMPYPLPKLVIDQFDETNHYIGDMGDISEYNIEQFKLENYQSHPAIKAPLSN